MNTPTVTVLMPVYNAGPFLKESIDSILSQTFTDFEFLIIDDGSTDQTAAIVESYSDARIRFVKNGTNLGISATLNKGIQMASGSLIARMDADDISYPERLKKQVSYMQKQPDCALLSTWARVVTEGNHFVRLERYRSEFYYYNLTFECWIYHPTIMFRRDTVIKVGMYSKPYSEDYDLFWRISTRYKIWNLAEPLLDYRIAPTSLNLVLRKAEYEIANEENVLRNLRFYMGEAFTLSKPILEALRHNFELLLQDGRTSEMLLCLKTLAEITDKIKNRANPNKNEKYIERAFYYKRRFILKHLFKGLPKQQGFELLIKSNAWGLMMALIYSGVQWRVVKIWRKLLYR